MASQKTAYYYNVVSGSLSNAYSVILASADGTYGIKKADGTVVVPNGTATTNPDIGIYAATFTVSPNTTYYASWKIIQAAGGGATYSIQELGPFTDAEQTIYAIADYKGTFTQGSEATLILKITDFDSIAIDADTITIIISDENGSEIETATPKRITTGYYVHTWQIASTQGEGRYIVNWNYTIAGENRIEVQEVVVAETVAEGDLYSEYSVEARTALETYIYCAQAIPVYFEQSKQTFDGKTFRFTFPRWNQSSGVKIYRNRSILNGGFQINYFKGQISFNETLTPYDMINADYNFRWFSVEDLTMFLRQAINFLNSYPPHTSYTIVTLPEKYVPGVLYKAAADAIRKMMLCLQFQEPQQVFGGEEGASKVFSNLETLKKNYETEYKVMFENKKFFPYVGLMWIVDSPEFTLPGGRSRWFRYLFSSGI